MGFFEIPELDPPRPWRPPPPWFQAPEHELGVDVAFRTTVLHDDDVWLGVIGITAFSVGFTLRTRVLRREREVSEIFQDEMGARFHDAGVTDRFLRLGVEFADGRRATNFDALTAGDPATAPGRGISFRAHRRGGGGRADGIHAWVWPLPPPGQLTLAAEWPSAGLELIRIELPVDEIRASAALSEPLWDDDPDWADSER